MSTDGDLVTVLQWQHISGLKTLGSVLEISGQEMQKIG